MLSLNHKMTGICLLMTTLFPTAALHANEPWEVTVTPYFWASGVDGKIDYGPVSAKVSYGFSDLIDKVNVGGSLLLEANRNRWVNWAEIDYFDVEVNNAALIGPVNADVEVKTTFVGVGTGYRFDISKRSTLDVLIGARYTDMKSKLKLSPLPANGQTDEALYDAIVVLRPHFKISDHWYFSPTASVGTGDTHLLYELSPQFEYILNDRFDMRVGYRNLTYEFKDGSDKVDITMVGLMLGVGITF